MQPENKPVPELKTSDGTDPLLQHTQSHLPGAGFLKFLKPTFAAAFDKPKLQEIHSTNITDEERQKTREMRKLTKGEGRQGREGGQVALCLACNLCEFKLLGWQYQSNFEHHHMRTVDFKFSNVISMMNFQTTLSG